MNRFAVGTFLLLGLISACLPSNCQKADSKGQKPPTTNIKPPQTPPKKAIPPKSSIANPQSPLPLPQPPATNHQPPLRLSWLGPLPAAMQQQTAHVAIDLGALGNSLPTFWRGNARTPAFGLANAPSAAPILPTPVGSLRKTAGANLTRLYPFATPGTLTLDPDGTPIVRWESVDAALRQAGQAGEDVVFNVQCPADLALENWRALVEATLRHYRENPPTSIARWEAALSPEQAGTRYEPFARLVRSLYPNTPVGLNLIVKEGVATKGAGKEAAAGDVAEAVRRIAQICAQNKVSLDSISWRLADSPALAVQQIQRVRRVLSAVPALKNVFLLPTFGLPGANAESTEMPSARTLSAQSLALSGFLKPSLPAPAAAPRLLSFVAQVLEAGSSAPPNALVGGLLEEPLPPLPSEMRSKTNALPAQAQNLSGDAQGSARVTPLTNLANAQQALGLLNRLAGTRLRAESDHADVRCLATRSQGHTLVLLWREPATASENRAANRTPRLPENSNALIVAKLQHAGLENTAGLRVTQVDLAQTLADSSSLLSTIVTVNNMSVPANAQISAVAGNRGADPQFQSVASPSGMADTFWNGNPPPAEIELPVLLPSGGICLLDVAPIKNAPSLASTLTTNAANLYGGDAFRVVLTVRNLTAAPQNLEIRLASPLRDLLPQGTAQFKPGTLAANATRAFSFELRAPVLDTNANVTLTARVGESAAMLTVPVQAPLEVSLESLRADVDSGTGRANAHIRLTNRGSLPLNVHLLAEANGSDKTGSTGTAVVVPTGSKSAIANLAVSPPSREPGLHPLTLHAETAMRRLQTLRSLIGVPLLCPYAVVKPVLDGDLREWAGNVPMGMGRAEQASGKTWGGPADVSAYAYAQWDEQFFYFACAVTDNVFTPPRAGALIQGDCVLFALAVTPRTSAQPGRASYAKFGMAIAQNGLGATIPVLVRLLSPQKTVGKVTISQNENAVPIKNARIAVHREDARTFYEAAIPWSELRPGLAAPDALVSLAILVNDVDGRAQGFMEWGSGLNGVINPLLFPPLRLVKPAAR